MRWAMTSDLQDRSSCAERDVLMKIALAAELKSELSSLEGAIRTYEQERTLEAIERICIKSRMAAATFEELACWTRTVDLEAQRELVGLLRRATELLDRDVSATDADCRYLQRIAQHCERVACFTLAMLDDRLPRTE
jgi:hypothetical protein